MPSGNIRCEVMDRALRCEIVNFSFARPPAPEECDSDWGHAYALAARGPSAVLCAGDLVVSPRLPVLGHGARWSGAGVVCTSGQAGLRCVNGEGRGMEMSRARLNRF
ncbi:DUF6636 domain-containing protein [Falsiroseomonas tokyonensis]|uniref:DUF6636 domain-containing protein n=1 Tax=Falsiroseomonas tokyonensis TaxID=430521 RepID=A0ABV7BP83_9PROT|nr:hypothetical protein [Falsiroseomonas tokyonensis]